MKIAVIGLGCWGLVLTKLLTNNFDIVYGWSRKEDLSDELLKAKRASRPFNVELSQKVNVTSDMKEAIEDADIILLVVSTSAIRPVCKQLKEAGIRDNQILVNTSKGLELPSLKRMSEVIKDELPNQKFAILSGPTLAKEVLDGYPTAATVAADDIEIAKTVQKALTVKDKFRLYTNTDIIGVELGGSLKNVIAIAAGFLDEMNFGDNSKGALLARGMAEIARVAVQIVWRILAQGKKIDDILASLGSVAEGVKTSKAVCELSEKLGIETPISNAIYKAVYSKENSKEIFLNLMNRQLKGEEEFLKK